MCLDKKGTFKPCRVGYKVMRLEGDNLVGEWRNKGKHRKPGVWLDESNFRDTDLFSNAVPLRTNCSNSEYPYGWHIYNRIVDAMEMGGIFATIVKVSVRNPFAVGYQGINDRRVTVAKHIKILKVLSFHECEVISREAAA